MGEPCGMPRRCIPGRRRSCFPTSIVGFLDSAVQPQSDQVQHARIDDPTGHRLHQFEMGNAAEVVGEVGVHDIGTAMEQLFFHLGHRLLGIAPSSIGIDLWRKVGFEDRFQHQHCCCHADPIPHGGNAQWPEFAVGFRYIDPSDRFRLIRPLSERKRQFRQPSFDAVLRDIRKVLTIHTRCALVGAALGIGMRQNVIATDLVVQRVEAIAGFRLRFRVQRRLQFLDAFRS